LSGRIAEQNATYASEVAGLRRLIEMVEAREAQSKAIVENVEQEWAAVNDRADRREAALLDVHRKPAEHVDPLGVHTGGVLGKLYADTLEEVSPLPLRGLRAVGATPLQLLVWGAWPEARRMLASYTLLRWEMNLRNSTVVGIAGGGGIGIALYNDVQLAAGSPQAFYPRVATLTLIVCLLVGATGWIGDAILRRLESASLAARRSPAR